MRKTDDMALFFVFGALRSGTTMFRLMLNHHEAISNPGEADFLFDYLRPDPGHPTGWRYDIEAMRRHRIFRAYDLTLPEGRDGLDLLDDMIVQFQARGRQVLTLNVHRHAGRIATLLPTARFIHILRDPRDVARSSIGMGWAGNAYHGIGHWIETERGWDAAAIADARVLTFRFEDLMTDLEGELKRICAFIGVPFSAAMLDYHQNTTYGPPDARLAEQWRRKAPAREIALLEGRCADLITARGYALNGTPRQPGRIEEGWIWLHNRTLRWRHNIRRFGLPLFLSGHLTRLVGAHGLHDRVRQRMDEKIIKALK